MDAALFYKQAVSGILIAVTAAGCCSQHPFSVANAKKKKVGPLLLVQHGTLVQSRIIHT
jgi:hypothetical protein